MRVNEVRTHLDSDEIVFAIMKEAEAITNHLKVALPRGWRLIVKVACDTSEGTPPHELLYVDLQADEGGGSWAEAKIQTLEKCPGWTATHPMEIEEIIKTLEYLEFDGHNVAVAIGEANLYAELAPEDIKWLVDVENGPGLAPGFGGIKIPYRCHYMEAGAGMADETGTVLIGFSGGAQWQDLQFALAVARTMRNHWDNKKDESLTMNFAPLKEYPEIEFWMQNLGLR